ncbi:MAG: SUMF1/EgtB/PvdO family nonheme iron enzyme [Magnetococcales bacterium]|nr:SUMF1/EgtB/PvdO family nonheme iron enzyme [Magnetococcales bacterium]
MPRKIDLNLEQAGELIRRFLPDMRMVKALGSGSFGQVFLLEDDLSRIAVKIIPLKMRGESEPEESHEWQQLTGNWDRLHHASLVRIRGFCEYTDPDPSSGVEVYGLIQMDYWPIDLHDFIGRLRSKEMFTPIRKRALLHRLARLLYRLLDDTGLIVTDLKLENILVSSRDPGPMELALIDFGGVCQARLADYYRVVTTDFFMAPELHDRSVTCIDEPILIYSFGLIGYYILEGRWPVADYDYLQPLLLKLRQQEGLGWSGEVAGEMPGCVAVVERCLREKRPDRFATLAELLAAMEAENLQSRETRQLRTRARLLAGGLPTAPGRKKGQTAFWTEPVTGMEFVWIPPGRFEMGQSTEENQLLHRCNDDAEFEKWFGRELPRHRVMLDGFWMGRFPVTRGQFNRFVEETLHVTDTEQSQFAARANPRLQKNTGWQNWKTTRHPQEENHPAIFVSWFDAQCFASWLAGRLQKNCLLPSEAQWEYACHGGGTAPFHFGYSIDSSLANYDGKEIYGDSEPGIQRKGTTPCGQFPANAFGLHDMHGNVWEWCEDIYDTQFYPQPAARQRNPVNRGIIGYRIKRGGSWRSPPALVRAAYRGGTYPDLGKDDLGFRLVIIP